MDSIAAVLRLLGYGSNGSILLALGGGPLRTKSLTQRVPGFAPRTVYRHARALAGMGLLERHEEAGVPSKVTYNLTPSSGRDLVALLGSFADASRLRLPDGGVDPRAWSSLELLAELWELGILTELSCESRSPTELANAPHGLSFHQIERRANLFAAAGLLRERTAKGRGKRFLLSDVARRHMALVAGIGRWRARHGDPEATPAISLPEMTTMLMTALPLVCLPREPGRGISLTVTSGGENGDEGKTFWTKPDRRGTARCSGSDNGAAEGWARGTVGTWLSVLLDGRRGRLQAGGDLQLVDAHLIQLHSRLWDPAAALEDGDDKYTFLGDPAVG